MKVRFADFTSGVTLSVIKMESHQVLFVLGHSGTRNYRHDEGYGIVSGIYFTCHEVQHKICPWWAPEHMII